MKIFLELLSNTEENCSLFVLNTEMYNVTLECENLKNYIYEDLFEKKNKCSTSGSGEKLSI